MGQLAITLFDRFGAKVDGQPIKVGGPKQQALLAYLAYNAGAAVDREELVGLLWSDRFDDQARQSLRQALVRLRRALSQAGVAPLETEGEKILFRADAASIDVAEFRAFSVAPEAKTLEKAGALQGELLRGMNIRQKGFDAWLQRERGALVQQVAIVFSRLSAEYAEQANWAEAIAAAERWAALDSLNEAAARQVMRCRQGSDDKAGALKKFQELCHLLRTELDADPATATAELAGEIRAGSTAGLAPVKRQQNVAKPAPTNPDAIAAEALVQPDKPSIAVLPFDNMSGDEKNNHICDGLTDTVIGALGKIADLLVISRGSTFIYRGKNVDPRMVAAETGARYILEGSVQWSGGRVRVSAQLMDSETAGQIWSERYERETVDLFAVFDGIAREIIIALDVTLNRGEGMLYSAYTTENLDALGEVTRGIAEYEKFSPPENAAAIRHFERALELDPKYATAWSWLAHAHWIDGSLEFVADPAQSISLARASLDKAVSFNVDLPEVPMLRCIMLSRERQFEDAMQLGYDALKRFPSSTGLYICLGIVALNIGDWDETIRLCKMANRIHPRYSDWYDFFRIQALIHRGDWSEAIAMCNDFLGRSSDQGRDRTNALLMKSFAMIQAGDVSAARECMGEAQEIRPTSIKLQHGINNFQDEADRDRLFKAYRSAGMPEE